MDSDFSLLIKYISHPLTVEERERVLQWRSLSPENELLFSEICKLRLLNEYSQRNTVAETAQAMMRIKTKIHHKTLICRLKNISKYAALVLLLVSLSIFGWKQMSAGKYTTICVTENESVKKVQFADGSTVWLSTASELHIPHSFSPTHREVSLIGRGFFEIKKDVNNPFTITGKHINIKVTGTTFDLKIDQKEKNVEAILVSGKIVLQDNNRNDIYQMNPGEKLFYNSGNKQYVVKSVDTSTLTAWHLDQTIYDNTTLREIVNKLADIYHININIQSAKLAERRFKLIINKEESLIDILNNIKYLTPLEYKIEGNEVFLTEQTVK
ncbi:MAG: FecR family protein [Paludibacter sp.]|nr:FecR family protein [Paludibacter sp.]MDD4198411.1 FecR family protein [Paludibacter sp.]MDD4427089.1 FecR family protein [Paludibacter sp.]